MSRSIQGWTVRAVPSLRREVLEGGDLSGGLYRLAIDNPRSSLLEHLHPGWRAAHVERLEGLERDMTALAASDLFWVATDMAAQALDASQDIPGFSVAEFVTPRGMVVFERPLPKVPTQKLTEVTDPLKGQPGRTWSGEAPVWALSWYPETAKGVYHVTVYTRLQELPFRISPHADLQSLWEIAVPAHEGMLFSDNDKSSFRRFEPGGYTPIVESGGAQVRSAQGVLAFLAAMNVLMNTPSVASRRDVDARTGKAPRPNAQRDDQVSVIDLRPLRYEETASTSPTGRIYRHRWVVRGHWAMQPHGPKQSLRKLLYREPYLKGPPDAPLLATERVYAWRR